MDLDSDSDLQAYINQLSRKTHKLQTKHDTDTDDVSTPSKISSIIDSDVNIGKGSQVKKLNERESKLKALSEKYRLSSGDQTKKANDDISVTLSSPSNVENIPASVSEDNKLRTSPKSDTSESFKLNVQYASELLPQEYSSQFNSQPNKSEKESSKSGDNEKYNWNNQKLRGKNFSSSKLDSSSESVKEDLPDESLKTSSYCNKTNMGRRKSSIYASATNKNQASISHKSGTDVVPTSHDKDKALIDGNKHKKQNCNCSKAKDYIISVKKKNGPASRSSISHTKDYNHVDGNNHAKHYKNISKAEKFSSSQKKKNLHLKRTFSKSSFSSSSSSTLSSSSEYDRRERKRRHRRKKEKIIARYIAKDLVKNFPFCEPKNYSSYCHWKIEDFNNEILLPTPGPLDYHVTKARIDDALRQTINLTQQFLDCHKKFAELSCSDKHYNYTFLKD